MEMTEVRDADLLSRAMPMTGAPEFLSPEQQRIADAPVDARLVVEAGPGTGKTETVAHRLLALLAKGSRPSQILVLSFSRNAVRTLTARLDRVTDDHTQLEEARYLTVRTFDSWTFRTLRLLGIAPSQLLARPHDANIHELVQLLRSERKAEIRSLLGGIRHIIVDEFQDLSGVRGALVLELLDALAPPNSSGVGFTVLGDPAQAIYAFANRDAEPEFAKLTSGALIRELKARYGSGVSTIALEHNYRAHGALASVAKNLRNLLLRRAKPQTKLAAMQQIVAKVKVTENGLEAGSLVKDGISTVGVLTSTNGEAIRVAQKLYSGLAGSGSIPIRLHSTSSPRAVPAWLGATLGKLKSKTLQKTQFTRIYTHLYAGAGAERARILGVPGEAECWHRLARACGSSEDDSVLDISKLRDRLGWVDLLPDEDSALGPGLHVMTIHQSKGMEFDAVAIMSESLNRREFQTDDEHLEAANVLFVAMTRAAKQLWRVAEGTTFGPLYSAEFNTHRRWFLWRNGWINVEAGCPGDVVPLSFVDRRTFGTEGALAMSQEVVESQEFLAQHADQLVGRKVVLCRWKVPDADKRFVYRIHLQESDVPGRALGLMSEAFTRDLLSKLYPKGKKLPKNIYNLRITDVVTLGSAEELPDSIASPFNESGLWLGVNIYGTGDFRTF